MQNKEDFINSARKIHGDKYDYSKVEYINNRTKVCIICPEHGEFWQTPYHHVNRGQNCPRCSKPVRDNKTFIKIASKKHNNKYDYSKVEYINNSTKVCIICPEHGEFWQTPNAHLNGSGCPKCSGKNLTNEEWIQKVKEIHGNKYDYSKVKYKNASTKVCIICPEHGEFWQLPSSHLKGCGCAECGLKKRVLKQTFTKAEFIQKAKEIHGNKYDYSKIEYINSQTKVCIICPEHGEFWQTPNKHLNGQGCAKCQKTCNRYTSKTWIEKAKEIHGDKYDYSKVEYKSGKEKVCIICPEHGEFWQTPNNHILGKNGCPKCGREFAKNKFTKNKEDFILDARKIHGDKYDYSKVEYINTHTKICIICPEHGEFWQIPKVHLQGCGCPKCNQSKLETEIQMFLKNKNIDFVTQKEFDWLKYFKKMKIDIFIPNLNIGIECQGEQHFQPVDFSGKGERWAKKEFLKNIKRDLKKIKLCNKNNILLLHYCKCKMPDDFSLYKVIQNKEVLINIINESNLRTLS